MPSQRWHAIIEAPHAIVSVRTGDARPRPRLKRGSQFRRWMEDFRRLPRAKLLPVEREFLPASGVGFRIAVTWAEDTATLRYFKSSSVARRYARRANAGSEISVREPFGGPHAGDDVSPGAPSRLAVPGGAVVAWARTFSVLVSSTVSFFPAK